MKIAAVALILLSIGAAAVYIVKTDALSRKITATTGNDEKNLRVTLPDGSSVILNRNTRLSYRSNFGRSGRNVSLDGEAFFEITPDKSNAFTVDAGKAMIKVLGTSFNVITNNDESAVEVFVETGHVMLYDESGSQNIMLDPGFVGTLSQKSSKKKLNDNPNYMAWNKGLSDSCRTPSRRSLPAALMEPLSIFSGNLRPRASFSFIDFVWLPWGRFPNWPKRADRRSPCRKSFRRNMGGVWAALETSLRSHSPSASSETISFDLN